MIRAVQPQVGSGWKVLIVDHTSMRIISAACRMYDVMEENITVVENIAIARQPFANMEAIYFLSPTPESVDALINDFKKKDRPMYSAVHLFFTTKLPEAEFQKISAANVASRIRTLKEFNMDFIAYERLSFHLDMNDAMVGFFGGNDAQRYKEIASSKLVTLMAVLNEYPIIRFAQSQRVSSAIADSVKQKLDTLARSATGWSPNEDRAILLILDRTTDPITPLLHEFTYQAMVYDLLNVQNDKYTYNYTTNTGASQNKDVILGETDVLWPVLRHMHIAETIEYVIETFNDFLSTNKATKLAGGKHIENLKDMSEAMRAMPQYTEMLSKYSLHISMGNAAMEAFNRMGLERIAHIEQDMATGEDADHKPVKNVISKLPTILSDPTVSREDKIRLLIIYIISQEGIKDQDRKRLMELAKVSVQDQAAIANISALGVTLNKGAKGKSKKESKKKKKKKDAGDDVPFELSRYVPTLAGILEDLVKDNLSSADFPFVRGEPGVSSSGRSAAPPSKAERISLKGAGSKQPRWADKGKKKEEGKPTFQGPRVIVFIAGGMTHAEMRTAYEVSNANQRAIFVGSTHIITPKAFLDDLSRIRPPP